MGNRIPLSPPVLKHLVKRQALANTCTFDLKGPHTFCFAELRNADLFVVQALPHDHDVRVDTSRLQILHDNWPEGIASGKWHSVPGEATLSSKRLSLRDQNANFATTMTDGTVYLAPGGGLMFSRVRLLARISDKQRGSLFALLLAGQCPRSYR